MRRLLETAEPPMYSLETTEKLYDIKPNTMRNFIKKGVVGYCKANPAIKQSMIRIPKSEMDDLLQFIPGYATEKTNIQFKL